MAFLNLFRKDPGAQLDRVEQWLANGDPVRALETAQRFLDHRDPAHRTRAVALTEQARDSVVATTLSQAEASEAAGNLEDAADWLRAALQHIRDGARQAELEARLESLETRAEQERTEAYRRSGEDDFEMPEFELDLEGHYLTLVDTFQTGVVERYEGRPVEFQQAHVDLNEGRAVAALAALEPLVARAPSDEILRLERGRCRLLLNDHAGARVDFEAAWSSLGSEPLDLAGTLTVPGLWAEATLAVGDAESVVERLRDLADPETGNPDLIQLFGRALISLDRLPEARKVLASACEYFPSRQDFPHDLAFTLARMGEPKLAIRVLEKAVAPSCATGNCARPPLHAPSLRALAALHLGEGGRIDRVEELMLWVRQAQGGRLAAEDQLLLARYHEVKGDSAAAQAAREEARRLESTAASAVSAAGGVPSPEAGAGRAAL